MIDAKSDNLVAVPRGRYEQLIATETKFEALWTMLMAFAKWNHFGRSNIEIDDEALEAILKGIDKEAVEQLIEQLRPEEVKDE